MRPQLAGVMVDQVVFGIVTQSTVADVDQIIYDCSLIIPDNSHLIDSSQITGVYFMAIYAQC